MVIDDNWLWSFIIISLKPRVLLWVQMQSQALEWKGDTLSKYKLFTTLVFSIYILFYHFTLHMLTNELLLMRHQRRGENIIYKIERQYSETFSLNLVGENDVGVGVRILRWKERDVNFLIYLIHQPEGPHVSVWVKIVRVERKCRKLNTQCVASKELTAYKQS